jgi:hypothetical protein
MTKQDQKQLLHEADVLDNIALDVRELPDQAEHSDPSFHANQIKKSADRIRKIAGRGTGDN